MVSAIEAENLLTLLAHAHCPELTKYIAAESRSEICKVTTQNLSTQRRHRALLHVGSSNLESSTDKPDITTIAVHTEQSKSILPEKSILHSPYRRTRRERINQRAPARSTSQRKTEKKCEETQNQQEWTNHFGRIKGIMSSVDDVGSVSATVGSQNRTMSCTRFILEVHREQNKRIHFWRSLDNFILKSNTLHVITEDKKFHALFSLHTLCFANR